MSAVASFYLINTSRFTELKQAAEIKIIKQIFGKKTVDNYWNYLNKNATPLKEFEGSGYIYASLLIYLEEKKDIDLIQNQYSDIATYLTDKRGCTHIIITHKQCSEFVDGFHLATYNLKEFQEFDKEFNGEAHDMAAQSALNGLRLLYENASHLKADTQVLLLIIG